MGGKLVPFFNFGARNQEPGTMTSTKRKIHGLHVLDDYFNDSILAPDS